MSVKVFVPNFKLSSLKQVKLNFNKPSLYIKKYIRRTDHSIAGKTTKLKKSFVVNMTAKQHKRAMYRYTMKYEQSLLKLCGTIVLYKEFQQIYLKLGKCPICQQTREGLDAKLEKLIKSLSMWIRKGEVFKEREKLEKHVKSQSKKFLVNCKELDVGGRSVEKGKRDTYVCLKKNVLSHKQCNVCDNTVTNEDIPGILSQIDRHVSTLTYTD